MFIIENFTNLNLILNAIASFLEVHNYAELSANGETIQIFKEDNRVIAPEIGYAGNLTTLVSAFAAAARYGIDAVALIEHDSVSV